MPRFSHEDAPDVRARIFELVEILDFSHIDPSRVHCRRSRGSTADAYARIWELSSMWREALGIPAQYVIEVLSEHFDVSPPETQVKTLIHELLHIPTTFSGALRNHRGQGEAINGRTVHRYYQRYLQEIDRRRSEPGETGQIALPFGPFR